MAAKPTELKKLVALLDAEAPDVEWLAKSVWELVENLLAERQQYVAIAYHPSLDLYQAIGPYATRGQLMKDYEKRLCMVDKGSVGRVALLKHPSNVL